MDGLCRGRLRASHSPALLPVSGLLGFVGFDAADVVRSTFHQLAHQIVGLYLKGAGRAKVKKGNDDTDRCLMKTPKPVSE